MRSLGVSEARLRSQLAQWVELHLVKEVPGTLLLLSRALYVPENLPVEDRIVAAIQALPEHAVCRASLTTRAPDLLVPLLLYLYLYVNILTASPATCAFIVADESC